MWNCLYLQINFSTFNKHYGNKNIRNKELISSIPESDYYKLLVKAASKDKSFRDFLMLTYSFNGLSDIEYFNLAIEDLKLIGSKPPKAFLDPRPSIKFINSLVQRIDEFTKVCKNKKLEADLINYALNIAFDTSFLNSFNKDYVYKFTSLFNRFVKLLNEKLHDDYLIEYKADIEKFYNKLKATPVFLGFK